MRQTVPSASMSLPTTAGADWGAGAGATKHPASTR